MGRRKDVLEVKKTEKKRPRKVCNEQPKLKKNFTGGIQQTMILTRRNVTTQKSYKEGIAVKESCSRESKRKK